jgi:alpha-glucuronidase
VGSAFKRISIKIATQRRRKRIGRAVFTPQPAIENFKKRMSLHSMKVIRDTTTADPMVSNKYPENFNKQIEKGYTGQEVFNIDETDLFHEQRLMRAFTSKNKETSPGFKNSADLSVFPSS